MILMRQIFQLIGSLSFILYGMKIMSDGIQKSASDTLHKTFDFMTQNRFMAVLTGLLVTAIIQSSGATSVMVISFVNAELLTLPQAIGVIFGANIGTTATAWLVTIVGFNFNLNTIALPVFGIGYFLTFFKRLKKQNLGEALMGFGLLFLGLQMLSEFAPNLTAENFSFLRNIEGEGLSTIFIGFLFGLIVTAVLHSSSATTAILITMGFAGVISWQFAATAVLGSNIGSTIDAVLASIGSKLNARRLAIVHVLFNVIGSIIALIFLHPFMALVDGFFPAGGTTENIGTKIAIFHTLFNTINTIIWLPFVNQVARFIEWVIKPRAEENDETYHLRFTSGSFKDNPTAYMIRAEAEVIKMSNLILTMFDHIKELFKSGKKKSESAQSIMEKLERKEDYADQMQEQLSNYLVQVSGLAVSAKLDNNIRQMLSIINDIENITDQIFELGLYINRSIQNKTTIAENDMEKLMPYIDMVNEFIHFVHKNLNKPLLPEQLEAANKMENAIDATRIKLRKVARVRLEKGANVKAELLYIEMVRKLEQIGDSLFRISNALAETE